MSSRTANQDKALAWYCLEKEFSPQLSAHPVYYFTRKSDGKTVETNIHAITQEWEAMRKAEKRGRGRVS